MRRADVRKIDDSRLGRAKLTAKGARPEPVAEVVKPVVAAKPAPKKKKSKFGKD